MTFILDNWKLILLLILTALVGLFEQLWQHEVKEFSAYKATIEQIGKEAKEKAEKIAAEDRQLKEKSDAENIKTRANLTLALNSLRNAHSSFVPAAPANSRRPDLICFDRSLYIRADGEFTTEARGLADEGSTNTIDLNTAKKWSQGLNRNR